MVVEEGEAKREKIPMPPRTEKPKHLREISTCCSERTNDEDDVSSVPSLLLLPNALCYVSIFIFLRSPAGIAAEV